MTPEFSSLLSEVENKMKTKVETFEEIYAGMNNRLFVLNTDSKQKLLGKIYIRDDTPRLYNEFTSFSFLRENGITQTPTVYFKNDELNYAVYSFEEGLIKTSQNLNFADIEKMLDFIIKLQDFERKKVTTPFNFILYSINSLNDFIQNAYERAGKLERYTIENNINPLLSNFLSGFDLKHYLDEQFETIRSTLSKEELSCKLDDNSYRLSTNDFAGANNTIFKKDGAALFIDFEYFGWDHPLKIIVDFVNHIKNKDIPIEYKKRFVNLYKERSNISPKFLNQLDTAIRLSQIDWVTRLTRWCTPENIDFWKHGNPKFDENAFISEKISELKNHLAFIGNYLL